MYIFSKLLLVSTILSLWTQATWSMQNSQEFDVNTSGITHSLPNAQPLIEAQDRRLVLGQLPATLENESPLHSSGGDFSYQGIVSGLGRLPILALPHLSMEFMYVKNIHGRLDIKRVFRFSNETFRIIAFGPSNQGLINYRTDITPSGAYQTESFSSSTVHVSSEERKKMRSKMGVVYPHLKNRRDIINKSSPLEGLNICHSIELQYIIPQCHDSNKDSRGLFPGCEEFNQHIQGPFASSVKGYPRGGIDLTCFYDETPLTSQQRRRLGYRNLTEWESVPIPMSFILKRLFSDEVGDIFYFPHDIGPSFGNVCPTHLCLYKRLLAKMVGVTRLQNYLKSKMQLTFSSH